MVIVNWIIFGWSIMSVTKTKLMGTIIYDVTKGSIIKVDMGRSLMGCFSVTRNCGLE